MPVTSEQIRSEVVQALRLDLVGPDNNHAFAQELLPESPSRWYLTGYLVPRSAPERQRSDPTAADEIDAAGEGDGGDDAANPERGAARKSYLPSSMGLTVLVAPGVATLEATVRWGDYLFEGAAEEEPSEDEGDIDPLNVAEPKEPYGVVAFSKPTSGFRRTPREEQVLLGLPNPGAPLATVEVPNSNCVFRRNRPPNPT